MKPIDLIKILLFVAVVLSGCGYRDSTLAPIPTQTHTSTALPPTATPTLHPTATATLTPHFTFTPQSTSTPTLTSMRSEAATMEPDQAKETIRAVLKAPEDCVVPCFLGIIPGQTTFDQAKGILAHLGLSMIFTITEGSLEYYGTNYEFENGLDFSCLLTIRNELVMKLVLSITPEHYEKGVPREWSAYSPDTLINRYGQPSRVEIYMDSGPRPGYGIAIFYNSLDMIIEYTAREDPIHICPLTDQYESIRVHLGKNPKNPPSPGVPLETAASMTIEEFAERMTGDPENACIDLIKDAFIP